MPKIFSAETQELMERGWQVRRQNFPDEILFDYPIQTESISLTGASCSLDCAHCGGHYLEGMTPIEDIKSKNPDELAFSSALVSGGCTPNGNVPFMPHVDTLHELKKKKRLNFHVGLLDDEEIAVVKDLADAVSFDFVAHDETIREVYGLQRTKEDYKQAYRKLREVVFVMPHVTLGLKGGEWAGEEAALDALEELGLDGLTFIVFIPTSGTRYADRQPLDVEEVVQFLAKARLRFPTIPIAMGCMRPIGRYRQILDEACVAMGLNRIVMPTPGARELVDKRGLKVIRGEECCAL